MTDGGARPGERSTDWQGRGEADEGLAPLHVLGLGADAGAAEIREAYRAFALRHHPDRGGDRLTFEAGTAAYVELRRRAALAAGRRGAGATGSGAGTPGTAGSPGSGADDWSVEGLVDDPDLVFVASAHPWRTTRTLARELGRYAGRASHVARRSALSAFERLLEAQARRRS